MLSAFLIICGDDRIASSIAKSLQDNTADPASEERELIDEIPKHLPIKVKLKKEKEKAFKDLNNEKWMHDLEVEVTNIGDKPIYSLSIMVSLPELTAPDGNQLGFSLNYGRVELSSIENKAEADDIPLKPGETLVLKPHKGRVGGWDVFRRKYNMPLPKKIVLNFVMLSFGDGTGFLRTDGIPVPEKSKQKSGIGRYEEKPNLNDSSVSAKLLTSAQPSKPHQTSQRRTS